MSGGIAQLAWRSVLVVHDESSPTDDRVLEEIAGVNKTSYSCMLSNVL